MNGRCTWVAIDVNARSLSRVGMYSMYSVMAYYVVDVL